MALTAVMLEVTEVIVMMTVVMIERIAVSSRWTPVILRVTEVIVMMTRDLQPSVLVKLSP